VTVTRPRATNKSGSAWYPLVRCWHAALRGLLSFHPEAHAFSSMGGW
jgi:hypothetical protein